ncbi:hypothetical protein CEP54_005548 [Fusarium duplospermum]|uniref:Uncharacterized protein n=1 Tax=Fusarium duplospermum TaxID=1325734 RepID=A0A428QBZ5_9HYPO|nr:hypothetical protein CEP54_005548 [Fusarium duplospermum]
MSSKIFGPKTATWEMSASKIPCKKCVEEALSTRVLQYEVSFVSKRNNWKIITIGDPKELEPAIIKYNAEKEESHPAPQPQPQPQPRPGPGPRPRPGPKLKNGKSKARDPRPQPGPPTPAPTPAPPPSPEPTT